ncbi:hypothetical protein DXG01_009227 [Tephrocybe rancida]|nr:hypothetical protein DXG01_009227 [Tephrocybe rancida]
MDLLIVRLKMIMLRVDFGWTQTPGFFAIMGGFQICPSDGTTRPFTLHPDDIGPCLEKHDITISEQDIQDKSKGDLLAKSLVLLQVTWFILQVVARAAQRLDITELEVVTLAFAILNYFTYFCWWNKPLDVNRPIQITADYVSDRFNLLQINSSTLETETTQVGSNSPPMPDHVPPSSTDGYEHMAHRPLEVLSGALLPLSNLRHPQFAAGVYDSSTRGAAEGRVADPIYRRFWSKLTAATSDIIARFMQRTLLVLRTAILPIQTFNRLAVPAIGAAWDIVARSILRAPSVALTALLATIKAFHPLHI